MDDYEDDEPYPHGMTHEEWEQAMSGVRERVGLT